MDMTDGWTDKMKPAAYIPPGPFNLAEAGV